MYQQITILTLHKQGVKQAAIAKQFGCHRNTVRNVIRREKPIEKLTRQKPSQFDQYQTQIKKWLDQNVTNLRIHELLSGTYGIGQTYTSLCKYIQKRFPKPVEAFGVQLTAPGDEAELDFGYLGMLPGKDGKKTKTWGICLVLSYSRAAYYGICYDQKLATLIFQLQAAFAYLGGVPKRLKVDNMKTAVIRNTRSELDFNQDFLEFARHYNFVVVPCTPYSPEQKGKVEAGIKYLQGNFVNGRTVTDDLDLARQLKVWMTTYANIRTHGTTKRVPWEQLLEREREALLPLPEEEYSFFERAVRIVKRNSHINFENAYYSVPCRLVGEAITVRFTNRMIRIIHAGEQVALHARSYEPGEYVTVREHLPAEKVYSETEHQQRVEEQMRSIGESAHEYFCMLLQVKRGYWKQTVRGVLGLVKKHSAEEVNRSLARALHYGATDVPIIRRILEQKLYLLPLEPILPKTAGDSPVGARELTYYTVYDAHSVSLPT